MFSDGSYGWHADCQALDYQQMAENPYQCPGTDAFAPEASHCTSGRLDATVPDEIIQQQQEAPHREYEDCLAAGNSTTYCRQSTC